MEIGRVLLRDAQYVWRTRTAVLERNAVVLQAPLTPWQAAAAATATSGKDTKPKRRKSLQPLEEVLPLDGSLSCEAVVVSSAHMNSVRLCDLRSGREFLVDTVTKGKKHVWIDLFTTARTNASRTGSWREVTPPVTGSTSATSSVLSMTPGRDALETPRPIRRLDLQQAVEMLLAEPGEAEHAAEKDHKDETSAAMVVRGSDVESVLRGDGSDTDFSGPEAAEIARTLVEERVLIPFCCSCGFLYRVEQLYRLNVSHPLVQEAQIMDVNVDMAPLQEESSRSELGWRCSGHLLWLHETAFIELLARFDQHDGIEGHECEEEEEGLAGTEVVQALLLFGAFSVSTAVALANELLRHDLIIESSGGSSSSMLSSFQLDTEIRYKSVAPHTFNGDRSLDNGDEERHVVAATERSFAARSMEERSRLEGQLQKLKHKHDRLFHLFCFCCALVLLDAWVTTALFPGPLKLSLVTGLLLWLTLRDGTATLSIDFRTRRGSDVIETPNGIQHRAQERQTSGGLLDPKAANSRMKPVLWDGAEEREVATTASPRMAKGGSSQDLMKQESNGRMMLTLSRTEEAEVHSFRLAIAQAASIPVEATHVYADEYLFSVLRVKNRAFAYAVSKMARIMEWRRTYAVESIMWEDVKGQLASGNMYWYGYDFQNRPILWVRAKLKDWSSMAQNREAEVRAHVFLLELGCRHLMPPGCTTYTIVTDSSGLGMAQADLRLMRGLLDVCVANFPDRIGMVHAGPLTRFLKYMTTWLWPFLPKRLRSKVSLMQDCADELAKHMKAELIPKHMGGTTDHRLSGAGDPINDGMSGDEVLDLTYMIDQQKRFMDELKI